MATRTLHESTVLCAECYAEIPVYCAGFDSLGRPCAAESTDSEHELARRDDGGYLCRDCD